MEIWDAYDENEKKTEMKLVRGEPIPKGLYHLVCQIVVEHIDGEILLMQRDYNKEVYPGMYETSASGSALEGETPMEAAKRELKEETGITATKLTPLYKKKGENFFWYSYLCITDCKKNSVTLQEGETIAYRWITKEEFLRVIEMDQYIMRDKAWLKDNYIEDIKNAVSL